MSVPPTDTFTKEIILELVGGLDKSWELYYTWSAKWTPGLYKQLPISTPNIILVVKDLLGNDSGNLDRGNDMRALAIKHPTTNFVFCVSVEFADAVFADLKNVTVVPIGGDWLNQIRDYESLSPVDTKNFNRSSAFISLSRGPRTHRIILTSYLYGTGLYRSGEVTFMGRHYCDFPDSTEPLLLSTCPWDFSTVSADCRADIFKGYDLLLVNTLGVRELGSYYIYETIGENNNIGNFNNNLRPMYANSFVEIVNETTFSDPVLLLTEKTMHCFAAFNFPILISTPGTVGFLRHLGFDMFDDVITHRYDHVTDSINRITTAISDNYEILSNSELAKKKWKECLPRFEKNWEIVKSGALSSWYEQRLRNEFANAINNLTHITS